MHSELRQRARSMAFSVPTASVKHAVVVCIAILLGLCVRQVSRTATNAHGRASTSFAHDLSSTTEVASDSLLVDLQTLFSTWCPLGLLAAFGFLAFRWAFQSQPAPETDSYEALFWDPLDLSGKGQPGSSPFGAGERRRFLEIRHGHLSLLATIGLSRLEKVCATSTCDTETVELDLPDDSSSESCPSEAGSADTRMAELRSDDASEDEEVECGESVEDDSSSDEDEESGGEEQQEAGEDEEEDSADECDAEGDSEAEVVEVEAEEAELRVETQAVEELEDAATEVLVNTVELEEARHADVADDAEEAEEGVEHDGKRMDEDNEPKVDAVKPDNLEGVESADADAGQQVGGEATDDCADSDVELDLPSVPSVEDEGDAESCTGPQSAAAGLGRWSELAEDPLDPSDMTQEQLQAAIHRRQRRRREVEWTLKRQQSEAETTASDARDVDVTFHQAASKHMMHGAYLMAGHWPAFPYPGCAATAAEPWRQYPSHTAAPRQTLGKSSMNANALEWTPWGTSAPSASPSASSPRLAPGTWPEHPPAPAPAAAPAAAPAPAPAPALAPTPAPKKTLPKPIGKLDSDGGGKDMTLQAIMQNLQEVDAQQVIIVRKIKHLGFNSAKSLKRHYASYGKVDRVLVSYSHVQSNGCWPSHQPRSRVRPASLGFIVMCSREAASAVLEAGTDQVVNNVQISVGPFKQNAPRIPATQEGPETQD